MQGDNRRQKEKDKQSLDEAADARRVEEEDMVIQKRVILTCCDMKILFIGNVNFLVGSSEF